MPSLRRPLAAMAAVLTLSVTGGAVMSPAWAEPRETAKQATATGYGGAVSTVDPEASAAAINVLRAGGNAADAAVAAAATLGVTEPYSAGIGGGGYFVFYDAATGKVGTIDGRETAPAAMPITAFTDPATGNPYPFAQLVSSGVSVGVPGTPATWERALERWGTLDLGEALKPAIKVANRGFVVDETFRQQTLDNKVRFSAFTSTSDLFLPGGDAPAVGTIFHNQDLAKTYRLLAKEGTAAFYGGPLAEEIAATVQAPPKDPAWVAPAPVPPATTPVSIPAFPGYLTTADLAAYEAIDQEPTHVEYRGYDVYGMAPSSSGGTTVGEALNILEPFDLAGMSDAGALHYYLEASALAFADRAKYVGDPAFVDVPTSALTDPLFGKERACAIDPLHAATPKPVPAGDVESYDGVCPVAPAAAAVEADTENISTTNLTVADKWGNVVEYTLTIEQTGGSGIVVPGRGFLLNNELTDFSTAYDPTDPNRLEPGKRPRSSMSPTIILTEGKPFLALGSPGGSTIITTVLQTILNRVDLGMSVSEALAAPRASQRNTASISAEQEFIDAYAGNLEGLGHVFTKAGDGLTSLPEIGAATAIEFGPEGLMTAAAEPLRRGGGSAMVVTAGS